MTKRTPKPIHPACAILRPLSSRARDALKADIAAHGQRERIELAANGEVLCGRHRQEVILELLAEGWDGAPPRYRKTKLEGEAAVRYVASKEIHRRHMDAGERAVAICSLEELVAELRSSRRRRGSRKGKTSQLIAELADCNESTAKQALRLAKEAPESLREVSAGKRSLNSAYKALVRSQADGAVKAAEDHEYRATPAWVMHALLLGEKASAQRCNWQRWWDPMAGEAQLAIAAAEIGIQPRWKLGDIRPDVAAHLRRFARQSNGSSVKIVDLFEVARIDNDVHRCVMNPAFSVAARAVRHIFEVAPELPIFMLQRVSWLDQARAPWLAEYQPDVMILPQRIKYSRADGSWYEGTDNCSHAWYHWPNSEPRPVGAVRWLPTPSSAPQKSPS